MRYETIKVNKLTPTIGAEISEIDLSQALSTQQFEEVHQALVENLVIFFRNQHLTVEQHKAFGRLFGRLHLHPAAHLDGHPEIFEIYADENSKAANGEMWHSDVSCDPEPPMGSILYLHEAPQMEGGGGDTLFANMYAAYEALSEPIRAMLQGLKALHDGNPAYSKSRYDAYRDGRKYPVAEHPIVRTHPVSGRKALYVNRAFTTHIVGLSEAESAAVLSMLFRHLENDDFKCRFRWQPRSIAFWDNRAAQHKAIWDYFPRRRYGHRVTVAGTKPV